MKKFYIVSLGLLLCAGGASAATRFKSAKPQQRSKKFRTEATVPLWRPSVVTDFMFMDDEWMKLGQATRKYDSRGNLIEEIAEDEDGGKYKTVNTYDEYNNVVTRLETVDEGDGWENSSKREFVYDPVVHSFFTRRFAFDWDGDDWVSTYATEYNDVTRNDAGFITEIVKSLPWMDEMRDAYRSVWKYNETTGKASEYEYYTNYSTETTEWELYDGISYRDIEWETTDGQMTESGIFDLVSGENKVKSATVYCTDGDDTWVDGYFFVEYSQEHPDDYFTKETYSDPTEVGRTTRRETIDANGSFRITESEYFDEDGEPVDEPTYVAVEEIMMDEHGNPVSDIISETFEGVTEIVAGMKNEYTYDVDGNITEVTSMEYDYETEEYFYTTRTVYENYVDAAGVESVVNDSSAAVWNIGVSSVTAECAGLTGLSAYNLQGVKVLSAVAADGRATISFDTLPAGIYLVHADGTASTVRFVKR